MNNDTPADAIKLLPCPFCGSVNVDAAGWSSLTSSGPACDDCGASAGSTLADTPEANIAAWNTRRTSLAADALTQADERAAHKLFCDAGMCGGDSNCFHGADAETKSMWINAFARHRTTSLAAQDGLVDALAIRDKAVAPCPADKRSLGDKDCPKCGSSSAGPCWLKVSADSTFVDSVRAALASIEVKSS